MKASIAHIKGIILIILLLTSIFSMAQSEKSLLRKGNENYKSDDMAAAAQKYQEALEQSPGYGKASYNLGNAYFKMQQLGEAAKQYEVAAADAIDKDQKSDAFHNLGNCFLNMGIALKQNPMPPNDSVQPPSPQQMFQASIENYKKALRLDSRDEESRYNLAYAQNLLDKEGGNGSQDQQKQDQKKDEKKDEKKEGDKGEDGKENPKDEGKDKEQPEPKPGDMSKEEAERMLKALDQQEKDLQEDLGKERIQKGKPIKIDKDW